MLNADIEHICLKTGVSSEEAIELIIVAGVEEINESITRRDNAVALLELVSFQIAGDEIALTDDPEAASNTMVDSFDGPDRCYPN